MTSRHTSLKDRKIILGLSGGVDSAVAAIQLLEQGARVEALHMTNWDEDDEYCTAAAELQDARDICERLSIPLHHANFSKEYRDRVFSYFLSEYDAGRTPNPDVLCNREIKFGTFRDYASRLGADMLATGHYARVAMGKGRTWLLKASDSSKDQSYFLHAVQDEALAETVFPLGDLDKASVRRIARENALPVHDKKDSTGICFIGERPFREFLSRYLPARPGSMQTPDGTVMGEHHGLMYYTLGQRQGLGIGGRQQCADAPWYVAAKDLDRNVLIVVQGDHELLYCSGIETSNAHWIGGLPDDWASAGSFECAVKIRYRQQDQPCRVTLLDENRLKVAFQTPQRAVTPGQFAVFYAGDRCLGGAAIEKTLAAEPALRKTG